MFHTLPLYAARTIIVGFFAFLLPAVVSAAGLSFVPASGTLSPGQTLSVRIVASSPQDQINAISGVVLASGAVEIVSISKSASVLNFWLEEPVSSATDAQFGGVVLSGYQGTAGVAATLTLRAKAVGTGSLSFTTGSVLANDGKGTELLTGTTGATFTVVAGGVAPKKQVDPEGPAPAEGSTGVPTSAFTIRSATHPDQLRWYKATTGTFTWEIPAGATATRLLLDRFPTSVPTKVYTTALNSKTIDGIQAGVSYLHVQHKVDGEWGGVGHFKINIDTAAPKRFIIEFPHGSTSINPQPIVFFNTTDSNSGIDHYEVKVGDGGVLATAASADSNPYTLPPQEPGKHIVIVSAYDAAGNVTTEEAQFTIEGITAPELTGVPKEITVGDILRVRGHTYPNATVLLTVSKDGEVVVTEESKSNTLGDFGIVASKRLWAGTYTITARVTDDRGARSAESEPKIVTVKSHFFNAMIGFVVNYFLIALSLMLAITGIAAFGIWSWFKLERLTRLLKQESDEVNTILHRSFTLLRKDLATHIKKLHRARAVRVLSNEELDFLEAFDEDLSEAERLIGDEVRDLTPRRKKGTRARKIIPPLDSPK